MEQNTLTELVRRCQQGDRQAQEKLILATQDHIYYHCRKMLRHEEDALDATQEILISMLQGVDKLREPAAFWGWLNRMIANRCKNLLTRGPKESQIPEDEEGNSLLDTFETLDEQTVPDKALDNEETRRMITELVDALPEAQRLCVLMFYYDEMSVKDIAAALETSEGTVKSRLNYGRKAIKEGVQRYEAQGIKLYSIAPLPLLLYFLRQEAAQCRLAPEAAASVAGNALAAVSAGQSAAASAAGAQTAAAQGTAQTAAAGAAAKAGVGLGTKLIAGALAAAVVVGGAAVGVRQLGGQDRSGDGSTSSTSVSSEQPDRSEGSQPTVAPAVRYGAYRDLLEALPQQYDLQDDYCRFALYDCDGDGEEELMAVLTEGIGYLIGVVYDVDEQGQVYELCQWRGEDLVNAGAGDLELGVVQADEAGATPYFAMRYGNCWGEAGITEDMDHYKLYAIEQGVLTQQYELTGTLTETYDTEEDYDPTVDPVEEFNRTAQWHDCTMNGSAVDGTMIGQVRSAFHPYISAFENTLFPEDDNQYREVVDSDGWTKREPVGEISTGRARCIRRCETYLNSENS